MRTKGAVLVVLAILAAPGCLFDPREAQSPGATTIQYLNRDAPRNVWENCRLALVNADLRGWEDSIHESFQYVPDTQTVDQFPGVAWQSWGRDQELTAITNWFANQPEIDADLLDVELNVPNTSGTRAEWDIIYYLRVTDAQGSTTKFRARATLVFELIGSYWFLTYWRDANGESDPDNPAALLPTLGVVRGANSG